MWADVWNYELSPKTLLSKKLMYLGMRQWWIFLIYDFTITKTTGIVFFSHGPSCGAAVIQCWSCRCDIGPGEPQCVSHSGVLLPSSGHWGCSAEGVNRQWPGGHPCSKATKHMVCQYRSGRWRKMQFCGPFHERFFHHTSNLTENWF